MAGMAWYGGSRLPADGQYYAQEDLCYENGESGFYLDGSNRSEYSCIMTPAMCLPKGFYTVEAEYEYRGAPKVIRMEMIYQDEIDIEWYAGYMGDSVEIPFSSAEIQVKYADRPFRFRFYLTDELAEGDYLLVRGLTIAPSPLTVRNQLFKLAVFFLAADMLAALAVCGRRIRIPADRKRRFELLVMLILVSCIPLMADYLYADAHDLAFHLMRIEGLKEELLNGNFPVRMQTYWLYGYGYPVSVFYGDLLLYIPALLRVFGVSVLASYNIYVLLVNAGTAVIAYFCFSKMSNERTGLLCACLYTMNIYRLMDTYTRAAVGEYTALMYLPLVLYGMWSIYMRGEDTPEHRRAWVPLTAGCAGIFQAHMLSTEITAFFLLLAALLLWKKTFRRENLVVFGKAVLATVLLSLWFLTPFLDYLRSDKYGISATGYETYKMERNGMFPAQLFFNHYEPYGQSELLFRGMGGDMPLTVGLALMAVLAGWFLFRQGKKRSTAERKEEYLVLALSALSIALATDRFPYTAVMDSLPAAVAFIKNIQFPWRFLSVTGLTLTWLACIIFREEWVYEAGQKQRRIFAGLLMLTALWQGISYLSEVSGGDVWCAYQKGSLPTYEVMGGEYLPDEAYVDDYLLYLFENADSFTYAEEAVEIEDWHRDRGELIVTLKNLTDQAQQVELPILKYKGYRAVGEDGAQLPVLTGTMHRIALSIPASYSGTVRVGFEEPWYWRVCELISLGALLCILWNGLRSKRRAGGE